jgi:hypothetical protein
MIRLALLISVLVTSLPSFGESRYSSREEPAGAPGSPQVVALRDNLAGMDAAVAPSEGGELSSFRIRFQGRLDRAVVSRARLFTGTRL